MNITAQTTLLEFVCWYADDLKKESEAIEADSKATAASVRTLRNHDDGSDAHRRAIVTADREAMEDFRVTGAALNRRRMFIEQLQVFVEPLFKGEQQ